MIKREKFLTLFFAFFFLLEMFSVSVCGSKSLTEDEQVIQVGVGAFRDGLYDIAEKQFLLFLREFSDHGKLQDVTYLLGRALFAQQKWKEAKAIFSRMIHENKSSDLIDYALFWIAQTEMKLGNVDLSRQWLLSLLNNYPKFEWMDTVYYLLGILDLEVGKLDSAESFLKRVPSLTKREELIRAASFWLGIVSVKQNGFEKATHYLKPLWEDSRGFSPFYRKETLFWLGEAQFKSAQFREAKTNYQTFYDQFKTDPLAPLVYWRIGLCEYRLGSLKDSIDRFKSFQSLFKESPLSFSVHYLLGQIYLTLGDRASFAKETGQLLQTPQPHPLWGPALLVLYWAHFESNEKLEADRIFQRLLKLSTFEDEKSFAQWLVAQSLFAEGKIRDALPYYFSIVNSKFREKALFQIGKGYFVDRQFREALTNFDLFLLEFPNSRFVDEGLLIKAESLLHLGDTSRASETYGQVIARSGKNSWCLMALTRTGIRHLYQHEEERAEEVFNRILKEFPDHPLFYHSAFHLGILSEKKGNLQEASRLYFLVLKGGLPELVGATYVRIGEALMLQEKEERAFTSFEKSLEYLSENSLWFAITQLEIGNLQRRRGRTEEARNSYRIVQTQSTDDEIKKAAGQLLDGLETR